MSDMDKKGKMSKEGKKGTMSKNGKMGKTGKERKEVKEDEDSTCPQCAGTGWVDGWVCHSSAECINAGSDLDALFRAQSDSLAVAMRTVGAVTKPRSRKRYGAKKCNFSELARLCREGPKKNPSNDFDTIAKVVRCDELPHGPHVEINMLARGNNCFHLMGTKALQPGAIYRVHVNYDADDENNNDQCTVGTISSVRYLGTPADITEACPGGLTQKVSAYVQEMLSFRTDFLDDAFQMMSHQTR